MRSWRAVAVVGLAVASTACKDTASKQPAPKDPASKESPRERGLEESKTDIAKLTVMKLAFEAYPQWARSNPDKSYPEKLDELYEFMPTRDTKDPWGNPYKLLYGATLPVGVRGGLAVVSFGEDGREGTGDDVKSWE